METNSYARIHNIQTEPYTRVAPSTSRLKSLKLRPPHLSLIKT